MTQGSLTLKDVVLGITLRLEEKRIAIPIPRSVRWHKLFYNLKRGEAGPAPLFLETLRFNWDKEYPDAPDLNELFSTLCIHQALLTTSPRFEDYTLSPGMKKIIRERLNELLPMEREYIYLATDIAAKHWQTRS